MVTLEVAVNVSDLETPARQLAFLAEVVAAAESACHDRPLIPGVRAETPGGNSDYLITIEPHELDQTHE